MTSLFFLNVLFFLLYLVTEKRQESIARYHNSLNSLLTVIYYFCQAFGRATKILLVLFVACAILDVPVAEGFFSKLLHLSIFRSRVANSFPGLFPFKLGGVV